MRLATASLMTIVTLLLFAYDAAACGCVPLTLADRYERSATVFTAVIAVEDREPAASYSPQRATVEILETFKGRPGFTALGGDPGSCVVYPKVGGEYLLFASESGELDLCLGSGKTDDAAADLAALRSFASGDHPDLAEPWRFSLYDGTCRLETLLDGGDGYAIGRISITASTASGSDPRAFAELAIQPWLRALPPAKDHPSPLELTIGGTTYLAPWLTGRVFNVISANGTLVRDRLEDAYVLRGANVVALVAQLTVADALRMRYDPQGLGPYVDLQARTTNLGDAGIRMLQCMGSTRRSD